MSASHYAELEVWQVSMELAESIYALTRSLPKEERFGLASQMQRAAVSVPSNIAEGNARQSVRDYARFVSMARGSTAELETQLLLTERIGIGDHGLRQTANELVTRVAPMLQRLHVALVRKAATESRVPSPESRSPGAPSPESR